MTKIKDLKHLRDMLRKGEHDYFIALAGGLCRSSKSIYSAGRKFSVLNEIDGTEETLTDKEIMDEKITNIGTALRRGAFYAY